MVVGKIVTTILSVLLPAVEVEPGPVPSVDFLSWRSVPSRLSVLPSGGGELSARLCWGGCGGVAEWQVSWAHH